MGLDWKQTGTSLVALLVATAAVGAVFGQLERAALARSGEIPLPLFAAHATANVAAMVLVLARLAFVQTRRPFLHVLLAASAAAALGEIANVGLLDAAPAGLALALFVLALSTGATALGIALRRRRPPTAPPVEGGLLGRSRALRAAFAVMLAGFLFQTFAVLLVPDVRARLWEEYRSLAAAQQQIVE